MTAPLTPDQESLLRSVHTELERIGRLLADAARIVDGFQEVKAAAKLPLQPVTPLLVPLYDARNAVDAYTAEMRRAHYYTLFPANRAVHDLVAIKDQMQSEDVLG